jgi:hypothetical protein
MVFFLLFAKFNLALLVNLLLLVGLILI